MTTFLSYYDETGITSINVDRIRMVEFPVGTDRVLLSVEGMEQFTLQGESAKHFRAAWENAFSIHLAGTSAVGSSVDRLTPA